ncbi:MAG: hypothetical protein ACI9WO_001314, partial [Sphingobacteriales bacterium]
MKKFLLIVLLSMIAYQGFSQTVGISYQAVILNPAPQEIPGVDVQNNILANSVVSIQFTVVNASGTVEYQEQHTTSTDSYGMINLLIGSGLPTSSGDFIDIVWNGSTKKLKVGIDFKGGSNFSLLSEQNLSYMPQPATQETIQLIEDNALIIAAEIARALQAEQTNAVAISTVVELLEDAVTTGVQGEKGDTGAVGAKGDQGEKGDTGAEGAKGDKGDTGNQGEKGDAGAEGKSAYQFWKTSNPTGTEAEYLASLKGEAGIKGDAGTSGINGIDGAKGNTGAKGDKGDIGSQGLTGATGAKGDTGIQGVKGEKGTDGSGVSILGSFDFENLLPATGTAGDSYLVQGDLFVWNSIGSNWTNVGNIQGPEGDTGATGAKGDQGITGDIGAKGDQGVQGDTGAEGKSAYEFWKITNPAGTEAEYLASLKGDQGDKGEKGTDGTGVSILGSFDFENLLPATGTAGDSYLIQGDLFVWNSIGSNWTNVGNIQGP